MSKNEGTPGFGGEERKPAKPLETRMTITEAMQALEKMSQVNPSTVTSPESFQKVFVNLPGAFEVAATHIVSRAQPIPEYSPGIHFGESKSSYEVKNKKRERIYLQYTFNTFEGQEKIQLDLSETGKRHGLLTDQTPELHATYIAKSTPTTVTLENLRNGTALTLGFPVDLNRTKISDFSLQATSFRPPRVNFSTENMSMDTEKEQFSAAAKIIVNMAKMLHEWGSPQNPQAQLPDRNKL